jgi:WD40 repeat protein
VVTVAGDGVGNVWDVATSAAVGVLEGHSDGCSDVVMTAKGRFAVTASQDGTACVWDLLVCGLVASAVTST